MIAPKTYPVDIHFDWLENKSEFFETDKTELLASVIFLINGKGVIFGKKLFVQSTYNKLKFKKEFLGYIKNLLNTKIIYKSNIYILTDIWSTGPYHFYVDVMAKVVELIDFPKFKPNRSCIVLFDDLFTNKVIEPLFKDLGFEELEIIKLKKNEQYALIGSNYFVTKPHIIGTNNSLVTNKVYSLIRNSLDLKIKHSFSPKVVYYFRKNRNRRVVNDAEIISALQGLDVFCTDFDSLSYLEAFALLRETKLLIGIHGGGLVNMIFMPRESSIIEIKNDNPNPNSHCYWHLARSLNFQYTMFVGETIGHNNVIEGSGCDVYVESKKLIELIIDQMIN